MGRIAVHEFMSLDGVYETPSWTMEYPFDPRMGEAVGALMRSSDAILLGRRTYELFAPAWAGRTASDDPGAPFMNDTPKHVVSGTLDALDWANATVLGPYSPEAIRSLKAGIDHNVYVSGSGTLVRAMLADGLVDELHLFVYPVLLGAGARLFDDGGDTVGLALTATEPYDNGVLHLTYHSGL